MSQPPSDLPGPALTLADFAAWADPPIAEVVLRMFVNGLQITPVGSQPPPPGETGRPQFTYDAAELMDLHAALFPWLVKSQAWQIQRHQRAVQTQDRSAARRRRAR